MDTCASPAGDGPPAASGIGAQHPCSNERRRVCDQAGREDPEGAQLECVGGGREDDEEESEEEESDVEAVTDTVAAFFSDAGETAVPARAYNGMSCVSPSPIVSSLASGSGSSGSTGPSSSASCITIRYLIEACRDLLPYMDV